MGRHQPVGPLPGFDRSAAEILFDELQRECGEVVDRDSLVAFAARWGLRPRYVRDVLGMLSEVGLVDHVRRDLWLLATGDDGDGPSAGRSVEAEWCRAALVVRSLGSWCIVGGAWSFMLRGWLPEMPAAAVRVAHAVRTHRLTSHARIGRAVVAEEFARRGDRPPERHVSLVMGEPIAVVQVVPLKLHSIEPISGRGRVVHAMSPVATAISLHEYSGVSGGMAVVLEVMRQVGSKIDARALMDAAARHPTRSVRRRVAFTLSEVFRETLSPHVPRHEIDVASWLSTVLRLPGGAPTLLDPARRRTGPFLRRLHVIDNRGGGTRATGDRENRARAVATTIRVG